MEAGTRELSGEKAARIVEAMRDCVAARGVAGATFEHVAREAGVSRGLLHYYFGSKERLLIEVVRRDSEIRVARMDRTLAAAQSVDDVLGALLADLHDVIANEPAMVVLIFDLFTEGRRNPEVLGELAELWNQSRSHVAGVLAQKDAEGVLSLRADPESVVSFLFALADGIALQALSDSERDHSGAIEASVAAARHMLGG